MKTAQIPFIRDIRVFGKWRTERVPGRVAWAAGGTRRVRDEQTTFAFAADSVDDQITVKVEIGRYDSYLWINYDKGEDLDVFAEFSIHDDGWGARDPQVASVNVPKWITEAAIDASRAGSLAEIMRHARPSRDGAWDAEEVAAAIAELDTEIESLKNFHLGA